MYFKDIVGQTKIKNELLQLAQENRVPHTQLFKSSPGVGAYELALAYARYLNCERPTPTDSCGTCPSCVKMDKLIHPDLHFIFPTIKKNTSKEYLSEWRDFVLATPYFTINQWLNFINAENAQAIIYEKDTQELIQTMALKSFEGKYKISIIWLPERMNSTGANRLLKLLEEPPKNTLFFLVSENPEILLPTILSRAQSIEIPALKESEIANYLSFKYGVAPNLSVEIAHSANGSINKALHTIQLDEDKQLFLNAFIFIMRSSYARRVKDIKTWSEDIAKLGREKQKQFLSYCQYMVRENFIHNFNQADLNYFNQDEKQFSRKFAPFINENNVIGIMNELDLAQQQIEQNGNAKIVLFDLALKLIVLIKQ